MEVDSAAESKNTPVCSLSHLSPASLSLSFRRLHLFSPSAQDVASKGPVHRLVRLLYFQVSCVARS